jgi:hypothetical protein
LNIGFHNFFLDFICGSLLDEYRCGQDKSAFKKWEEAGVETAVPVRAEPAAARRGEMGFVKTKTRRGGKILREIQIIVVRQSLPRDVGGADHSDNRSAGAGVSRDDPGYDARRGWHVHNGRRRNGGGPGSHGPHGHSWMALRSGKRRKDRDSNSEDK